MGDIKVIGVDPAPSKGSTVFDIDNGFQTLETKCLDGYLKNQMTKNEKILVCWDAPLVNWNKPFENNFFSRSIERFFQTHYFPLQNTKNVKKIDGVSVLGYAACSHWTISQYCLGFPIISQYDKSKKPFELITENSQEISRHSVVEVHPAVAIYFWLGKDKMKPYKGKSKKVIDNLWSELIEVDCFSQYKNMEKHPNNDDQLDALVAYVLGIEWTKKDPQTVKLFGNNLTGSFLLPVTDLTNELCTKFEGYINHNKFK